MGTPDCYRCVHRRNVPGSTHSQCKYPGNDDSLLALFGFQSNENITNAIKLNIQAAVHGVVKGWFIWPVDFDPVWLRNCDGFEDKEAGNDTEG